jgi:hypothetical protein
LLVIFVVVLRCKDSWTSSLSLSVCKLEAADDRQLSLSVCKLEAPDDRQLSLSVCKLEAADDRQLSLSVCKLEAPDDRQCPEYQSLPLNIFNFSLQFFFEAKFHFCKS